MKDQRKFKCTACELEFEVPFGTGQTGKQMNCPSCGAQVYMVDAGGFGARSGAADNKSQGGRGRGFGGGKGYGRKGRSGRGGCGAEQTQQIGVKPQTIKSQETSKVQKKE